MGDSAVVAETPNGFEQNHEPISQEVVSSSERVLQYGQGSMSRLNGVVERLQLTSLGPAVTEVQNVQQLSGTLPDRLSALQLESLGSWSQIKKTLFARLSAARQEFQKQWLLLTLPTQLHLQIEGISQTLLEIAQLPDESSLQKQEEERRRSLEEKALSPLDRGMLPHKVADIRHEMAQQREDIQRQRAQLEDLLEKMHQRKNTLLALTEGR